MLHRRVLEEVEIRPAMRLRPPRPGCRVPDAASTGRVRKEPPKDRVHNLLAHCAHQSLALSVAADLLPMPAIPSAGCGDAMVDRRAGHVTGSRTRWRWWRQWGRRVLGWQRRRSRGGSCLALRCPCGTEHNSGPSKMLTRHVWEEVQVCKAATVRSKRGVPDEALDDSVRGSDPVEHCLISHLAHQSLALSGVADMLISPAIPFNCGPVCVADTMVDRRAGHSTGWRTRWRWWRRWGRRVLGWQ